MHAQRKVSQGNGLGADGHFRSRPVGNCAWSAFWTPILFGPAVRAAHRERVRLAGCGEDSRCFDGEMAARSIFGIGISVWSLEHHFIEGKDILTVIYPSQLCIRRRADYERNQLQESGSTGRFIELSAKGDPLFPRVPCHEPRWTMCFLRLALGKRRNDHLGMYG